MDNNYNDKIEYAKQQYEEYSDYLRIIDKRLEGYIWSNLFESDLHGLYEKLACVRFLTFFDKYNFNVKAVKRYIKFAEALPIKSERGMQIFKLEPFQVFFISNIFGWVTDDGRQVFKDAMLHIPRKASKTSMIAQLCIWNLIFGPADGQIYCASNSFNQSQVLFKIIEASIKSLDPKMRSFHRNRQQIYSVLPGKESFISCLSSSPDRLDGLNPSCCVIDEGSQAKTDELRNVLTSGMGARENPLVISISTASTLLESPYISRLDVNKKILRGELSNDDVFALIYEPDEGDDISDPAVWKKVQPMLGISVKPYFYESEYRKALTSADDMTTFKTKLLNMFTVSANSTWIKPAVLAKNLIKFRLTDLTSRPICMVGVDLSVKDDMTAVTYGCYDSLTKMFAFYTDFYIPEETLKNHPNHELYQKWFDEGYLKVAGIDTIDYVQVGKDIIENSKYVNIYSIGYDAYKSKELVNYLKAMGVKTLHPFKQVYSEFTPACVSLEIGLSEEKMKIDDNPIISWMFRNVVLDTDNMNNTKPLKASENRKIDGVITILESLGQFISWKR